MSFFYVKNIFFICQNLSVKIFMTINHILTMTVHLFIFFVVLENYLDLVDLLHLKFLRNFTSVFLYFLDPYLTQPQIK